MDHLCHSDVEPLPSCNFERGKPTACVQLFMRPLLLSLHYSTAEVQQHNRRQGKNFEWEVFYYKELNKAVN
jgi:hypothetical protein